MLSFFKKLLGKKKNSVKKSVKVFLASIKSIDPIQKYLHITESCARILKIFFTTNDLSINFLISFG